MADELLSTGSPVLLHRGRRSFASRLAVIDAHTVVGLMSICSSSRRRALSAGPQFYFASDTPPFQMQQQKGTIVGGGESPVSPHQIEGGYESYLKMEDLATRSAELERCFHSHASMGKPFEVRVGCLMMLLRRPVFQKC